MGIQGYGLYCWILSLPHPKSGDWNLVGFVHRGAGSVDAGPVFEVLPKADLFWIAGYPSGEQLRSYILLSKGREEEWRNADSIQGSSILAVTC